MPRKNLQRLGGVTLVRRAVETTLAAGVFDVVALSSDDPEILAEARGTDAVALERPPGLAASDVPTFDVVAEALGTLERDGRFAAVAVVQCTAPFTSPADLVGAVRLLHSTGAASVVSVVRVEPAQHPLKLKVMDGDRLRPYLADDAFRRGQDLPPLWVRNGSVYVSRRDVLDRGVLVDADDVRGYEMPPERSFDIDTPRDLAFAEFLLQSSGYSL